MAEKDTTTSIEDAWEDDEGLQDIFGSDEEELPAPPVVNKQHSPGSPKVAEKTPNKASVRPFTGGTPVEGVSGSQHENTGSAGSADSADSGGSTDSEGELNQPEVSSNLEAIDEERLQEFSDLIISQIVSNEEGANMRRAQLFGGTRPELFKDENHIIYKVFYNFRDKDLQIDQEFLNLYLMRNVKVVTLSKKHIEIEAFGEIDEDYSLGYISGVLKKFNKLKKLRWLSDSEFKLTLEKYTLEFQAHESQRLLYDAMVVMNEGITQGSKVLHGFTDGYDFLRKGLAEIEGLVDKNQGAGFTDMKDLFNETSIVESTQLVADFGTIEELNQHLGGVYTGNLYTVLGATKGGKSKFCARINHTALLNGQNISVWAAEGGNKAWEAQLRAIHFDYTYNQGIEDVRERKLGVDQGVIITGNYPSQEIRDLELASAQDLITNPAYGNINYIDRPFLVETFIDELDTSVKANGSTLAVIDYMQLIGSHNSRWTERERIASAYPALSAYLKKNNVAVVSPAQYSQEVIKDLAVSKSSESKEMRTAGGGSAEIIRSSDTILTLWASTEDLINNRMRILSIPGRFSKPFDPIDMYVDLGTCSFYSLGEGN